MGTRGSDSDLPQYGILFAGLILIEIVVFFAVAVFTGVAFFFWGLFLVPAGTLAVLYVWRSCQVKAEKEIYIAMLDKDERTALRSISQDPLNAAGLTRLSEICEVRGQLDRAVKYMERVCDLEPTERNRWKLKDLRDSEGKLL